MEHGNTRLSLHCWSQRPQSSCSCEGIGEDWQLPPSLQYFLAKSAPHGCLFTRVQGSRAGIGPGAPECSLYTISAPKKLCRCSIFLEGVVFCTLFLEVPKWKSDFCGESGAGKTLKSSLPSLLPPLSAQVAPSSAPAPVRGLGSSQIATAGNAEARQNGAGCWIWGVCTLCPHPGRASPSKRLRQMRLSHVCT